MSGLSGPIDDAWVETSTGRCWEGYAGGDNTDPDGYYRIRGLPPGDIFVHVWPGEVNYFEQWYDGSVGTQDCNSAMPVTITSGGTETVDFALEAGFSVQGSVMNIHQAGGNFDTYIGVVIGGDFVGDLPGDISSIEVTDPDGAVIASYPGTLPFDTYWESFELVLPGSPTPGVYTFTVISTDATVTTTDYQYVLRTLPIPDTATFSPADGTTITSQTPTFSWDNQRGYLI